MSIKILNYFRENIPIPIFILFFIMTISALFEIVGIGFFIPLLDTQSSSDLVSIINFIFSSILMPPPFFIFKLLYHNNSSKDVTIVTNFKFF